MYQPVDFVLALTAHIHVDDGDYGAALRALVLLVVSYVFDKKAFNQD